MMRGEEPCRTWDGMKDVLQRRFGNGIKFLDTKPIVPSSWSDSVIGDAYLPIPRRQASVINSYEKKLGSGARYSKLMYTETSSSPKTYQKNIADPHKYKFEMKSVCYKGDKGACSKG